MFRAYITPGWGAGISEVVYVVTAILRDCCKLFANFQVKQYLVNSKLACYREGCDLGENRAGAFSRKGVDQPVTRTGTDNH